jgi:DNA-binding beta-propeller fold protein YncE
MSCKQRRHVRSTRSRLATTTAAAAVLLGLCGAAAATSAPRLAVAVSVPSVLTGNSRHLWLANTGTSSVLELATPSGAELRNVGGTRYRLDDSDAIATAGSAVWVANASSDTVTEFRAADGHLLHVLGAPRYRFEVPIAIAIASHHVFVLSQRGNRILELSEATGRILRVLAGPRFHFVHTAGLAVVGGDIWTANGGGAGTLTELNATTGRVMRVVSARRGRLGTPVAIATDGVHVWVANAHGNHLSELVAASGSFLRSFRIAHSSLDGVTSIAIADRVVWVARAGPGTLVVGLNARSGRAVRCSTHRFGYPAVFSDGRHVWIVDRTESRVSELAPLTGRVIRVVSS